MKTLPGETELKLWLRLQDVEAFRALPRLARARPHETRLRTLYFDTPDFKLARHGIALRTRKTPRGWQQTLKTEGEKSGGLSKRRELESAVARPAPDFSLLPAELAGRLIPGPWRAELAPVYETRFLRTTWNLRTPDGSRVEVALDVGEIVAGKHAEPLCEVELELKSGADAALYELAQGFARQILLIPFDASKAERGARLAAGKPRGAVSAMLPQLEKGMPACAAFAQIARACLAQFQANLPGLLETDDPEYLHQARVALRRLRSAARLFARTCPLPEQEMGRIAELGRALGEARDWDVFVLQTLPALLGQLPPAQKSLLGRRAQAARRRARAAALESASAPQSAADLLALHRWLHGLDAAKGRFDLARLAKKKLGRLHAEVLAAAEGFAQQPPAARHRLRIRVKRLRYALDYLGCLFGGHTKFAAACAALQDELGELNDAGMALRFLASLNSDQRLDGAVAQLGRILETRVQGRIGETATMLKKFCRRPPPWQ